jgi:hypothetical protein
LHDAEYETTENRINSRLERAVQEPVQHDQIDSDHQSGKKPNLHRVAPVFERLSSTARRLRADPPDTNSKADQRWRAITVPGFNILYKTLADDDGWESGLGPFFPNRDEAPYFFNKTMAKYKGLGQFTFDESDIPSDYYRIDIVTGPIIEERNSHPLYMCRA